MDFSSALALVIATFIFVITPGPGIIAIISTSLSYGFKSGATLSIGLIFGDIVYLLVALFGLALLMEFLGDFFMVVRIIGGAYFLYLGYTMVSSKVNRFELNKNLSPSLFKTFFQGLFISLSNPKVILFYLGFLPAFMDLSNLTTNDIILVVTLIFFTLMAGAWLYAFMVSKAKEIIDDKEKLKLLNKIAGGLMIIVGLFLISGY
jgi:threonine/homoserine/homoserine lactone efflux protein